MLILPTPTTRLPTQRRKTHCQARHCHCVTIERNFRQGEAEAEEKGEVATETESATREFVVLVPDPIVSAPWLVLFGRGEPCVTAVKTRHTLWCRVSRVPSLVTGPPEGRPWR